MRFVEQMRNIFLGLIFGSLTAFVMVGVLAIGGSDAIIRTGRSCGFSMTQAENLANIFTAIGLGVAGIVTLLWIIAVLRDRGADNLKFDLGAMISATWVMLTFAVFALAMFIGLACEVVSWFREAPVARVERQRNPGHFSRTPLPLFAAPAFRSRFMRVTRLLPPHRRAQTRRSMRARRVRSGSRNRQDSGAEAAAARKRPRRGP